MRAVECVMVWAMVPYLYELPVFLPKFTIEASACDGMQMCFKGPPKTPQAALVVLSVPSRCLQGILVLLVRTRVEG